MIANGNTKPAIGDRLPRDPRHETFFFDFTAALSRCESLQRHPERVALMCQAEVRNLAPGELMVPDDKGFYLVVRTRRGADAEALVSNINTALHQRLFGTRSSPDMVSTFRAVAPDSIVELTVDSDRHLPRAPKGVRPPVNPTVEEPPQVVSFVGPAGVKPGLIPLFHLQQQDPPIFLCGAVSRREGRTLFGSDAMRFCHQQYRPSVDLALLRFSLDLPAALGLTGPAGAVASCVSFDTLSWLRSRQIFVDVLKAARNRSNLILKIDDLPTGTPASRLADIVNSLKPLVKQIFVQLPNGDATLLHSPRIGLAGVCAALPAGMPTEDLGRTAAWLERTAFAQQASSCVADVQGPDVITQLRKIGITYAAQWPEKCQATLAPRPLQSAVAAARHAA